MPQDENVEEAKRLLILSPEEKASIEQTIDEAFEVEKDRVLPLIERRMQTLNLQAAGTEVETLRIVLQSMWNFFQALNMIQTQSNLIEARNLLESAADGFHQIRHEELRDLSIGVGAYAEAVINLQEMNVGQALELLTKTKDYLRNAGRFSRNFEPFIDHMEPDILFVAGLKALQNLDMASAYPLIEKASQAAEGLAYSYYTEEEPPHFTFQGKVRLYKAFYIFYEARNEFGQFEYSKLAAQQDLAREAIQAQELLNKGGTEDVNLRNAIHLSNALAHILEVISEIAQIMQRIFSSTFKPDLRTFVFLKQKVHTASLDFHGSKTA